MRSGGTDRVEEFWAWFAGIAPSLAANVEEPTLVHQLDTRVRDLDKALSWEIGPGVSKPWQLVISPNLDPELRGDARAIISRAPEVPGWEFHPSRQAKSWNYQLQLDSAAPSSLIDASKWTFVLLRHPDGAHEVLLRARDLPTLSDDERWQAAAMALESILGEDAVMDRVQGFELLDELEPRFAEQERPIQELRKAVLGN
jgi:hypothetical protein